MLNDRLTAHLTRAVLEHVTTGVGFKHFALRIVSLLKKKLLSIFVCTGRRNMEFFSQWKLENSDLPACVIWAYIVPEL